MFYTNRNIHVHHEISSATHLVLNKLQIEICLLGGKRHFVALFVCFTFNVAFTADNFTWSFNVKSPKINIY